MKLPLHRQLWAKSDIDGVGHSLLGHLIDVGLVAKSLLTQAQHQDVFRRFSDAIGQPENDVVRSLAILVAAHDIGKASPSFQQKWPPGVPTELREDARFGKYANIFHGEASAIYIFDWLKSRGWKKRLRAMVANAAGIHHGRLIENGFWAEELYDYRALAREQEPWASMRNDLFADLEMVFGQLPDFSGVKIKPDVTTWLVIAGLTTVADWIGSGLSHLPPIEDPIAYANSRAKDIESHFDFIGWNVDGAWWRTPEEPEEFASWFASFGSEFTPRPLQLATELSAQKHRGEPSLTIIEAPMGEGKTEAALYLMTQDSQVRGAYFALPTQATSDALFDRVQDYVDEHSEISISVALIHASARLTQEVRARAVDAEGVNSERDAIQWFSTGRKELLSRIGVGTVDQALLGVLPVKHHFVRLWGLSSKVVVLDEVHAYDEYTGGLITNLVRWLGVLGSSVVLMSATLPDETRKRLVTAFAEGLGAPSPEAGSAAYPRLTKVTRLGLETIPFSPTPGRERSISITAAPYDEVQLAQFIMDLPKEGAIGVIVNTVGRAQALFSLLQESERPIMLLHAQLPLSERKAREHDVLRKFGAQSRGVRTGVVIATQVIEQSLDLDFDILISDLAPTDLVLQRAGRLHRHNRPDRGPIREPLLHIAGLENDTEPGPVPLARDLVYSSYIQWRSWALLSDLRELSLPADIDKLVQITYSDQNLPALEEFSTEVKTSELLASAKRQLHEYIAQYNTIPNPTDEASSAWSLSVTDDEEKRSGMPRLQTRLGDESVSAIPIVVLANNWQLFDDSQKVKLRFEPPEDWQHAAALSQIRFNHPEHVQALLKYERPTWWERSPILRHLYIFAISADGISLNLPGVTLDSELGLVIRRGEGKGKRG